MELGALLVLIGLLFAVLDCFIDTGTRLGRASLLHVAVILIAIGVLLGVGDLIGSEEALAALAA